MPCYEVDDVLFHCKDHCKLTTDEQNRFLTAHTQINLPHAGPPLSGCVKGTHAFDGPATDSANPDHPPDHTVPSTRVGRAPAVD